MTNNPAARLHGGFTQRKKTQGRLCRRVAGLTLAVYFAGCDSLAGGCRHRRKWAGRCRAAPAGADSLAPCIPMRSRAACGAVTDKTKRAAPCGRAFVLCGTVWSGYAPLLPALLVGGSAEGARSAAEGAPMRASPCRRRAQRCRRRGAAPSFALLKV